VGDALPFIDLYDRNVESGELVQLMIKIDQSKMDEKETSHE